MNLLDFKDIVLYEVCPLLEPKDYLSLLETCKTASYIRKHYIEKKLKCFNFISAAENGHLDVIEWYFSKYNVEVLNFGNGCGTAIKKSAENNHLNIIQYIYERCSFLHYENYTDLRKKNNILEWLVLNYKPDVYNFYVSCMNAVNLAAENNHIEIIKWFHGKGYNGDFNGMMGAILNNHNEIVKYLYSYKYPIDKYGVKQAIIRGHVETIKFILTTDYNFNIHLNEIANNIDIFKLIFETKEDYKQRDNRRNLRSNIYNYVKRNNRKDLAKLMLDQKYYAMIPNLRKIC